MLRLGGQWCGCEAGHCQLTEEEPSLRRRLPPLLLLLLEAEPNATCSRPSMISPQDFKLSHNVSSTNLGHLSLSWHLFDACWQQCKARNELDFMAKGCYLLPPTDVLHFPQLWSFLLMWAAPILSAKLASMPRLLKPGCGYFYINWHLLSGLFGDFLADLDKDWKKHRAGQG